MISDRKITELEGTYLGNETKMFGELTNVIFGCAGALDMICLFRKYVVGDVTILRDSTTEKYTDGNLLSKLIDVMHMFRRVRSGNDFFLTVMVGRLVTNLPDLHVIDSHGRFDLDFTKQWITIGSGRDQANPLLEQEFKKEGNMKDFASLSYSIIKYIEEQDPKGSVGVRSERPNIAYLRYGAQSDSQPPEEDWKNFETSLPEYYSHFKK